MKKQKITLLLVSLLGFGTIYAQTPEDVLRFSGTAPKGSARSMAIGGAMGSLGGDIQSNFINPAGLGFYKTSEFVISPTFLMNKNKSLFRGDQSSSSGNSTGTLGTTGFVFGYNDRFSNLNSKAFSIAINRTADFNNKISYKGLNDFSSMSEMFAEEFASSGLSIDDAFSSSRLSLGTKLALFSYYIDTAHINGGIEVLGAPWRSPVVLGTEFLVNQQKDITTKGGISEIAISFAGNSNDKFYIGGSLGIPIMNYHRTTKYFESNANGIPDTIFTSADYREELNSKGVGFNGKVGIIFKPTNQVRLGAAIHTPTIYGIRESVSASLTTMTSEAITATEKEIYPNQGTPTTRFDVVSPWKFMASGSYLFSASEDPRKQLGFITADVEYVTYSSTRFSDANEAYYNDNSYYTDLNGVIKDYYKGALNFRIGGEVKFHTFMVRGGFAHYGNPYTDANLKNTKQILSGGLGYRDHGIFVDLTYAHNMSKDDNFPYRLGDKANTFADIKSNFSNVVLTFGIKF